MRHNLNGEWGYTRVRRNPTAIEQAVLEVLKLKSEYRALVGDQAAHEFFSLLPDDPKRAGLMLLDELSTFECTCGVSWISDPCAGCVKTAQARAAQNVEDLHTIEDKLRKAKEQND